MAVAALTAEPLLRERRPGVRRGELPGECGAGHAGLTQLRRTYLQAPGLVRSLTSTL